MMLYKVIAIPMLIEPFLVGLSEQLAALAQASGGEREAFLRLLYLPGQTPPFRLISVSTESGYRRVRVVVPKQGQIAFDAHSHPDDNLMPSLQDIIAMKRGNLAGIIVFDSRGLFKVSYNPYFNTLNTADYDYVEYNWCNIQRVIGMGIMELLEINDAKLSQIAKTIEAEIDSILRMIVNFTEGQTDSQSAKKGFTTDLGVWVSNSKYINMKNSLVLDGHQISHGIENFITKNTDYRNYANQLDVLAKEIFFVVMNKNSFEDTVADDPEFSKDLLKQIKVQLSEGGETSFLNRFSRTMALIVEKTETTLATVGSSREAVAKPVAPAKVTYRSAPASRTNANGGNK